MPRTPSLAPFVKSRKLNPLATEKSSAIVLRVVDFSETSCVVTLYTREFGKIGALAKGARRPKSSFEAALDLLAICRVVFIHKSSDALDLLTEAKLERRFRAGGRELSRLYAGYYLAELLDKLTDRADPHLDLYDLAEACLVQLDDAASVAGTVLRFELQALQILGHLPSLRECVECGEVLADDTRYAFGMLAGGVLCKACRRGQRHVVSVSAGAIEVLRQAAARETTAADAGTPAEAGEARSVMNHYVTHLLGNRPRMHAYLHAIL
jgi:DNA repair protein RecO (recombination protein O)